MTGVQTCALPISTGLPGSKQNRLKPRVDPRLNIDRRVPYHKRTTPVNMIALHTGVNQARFRFPAGARDLVLHPLPFIAAIRVMRTIDDIVEVGPPLSQQHLQAAMNTLQLLNGTHSTGDDRLIGDQDAQVRRVVDPAYRLIHILFKLNLVRMGNQALKNIDRPIPIQKDAFLIVFQVFLPNYSDRKSVV